MQQQILDLFKTRDQAVKLKDKQKLLATHVTEIFKSETEGYLSNDEQITEVLFYNEDTSGENFWIVLVKEAYFLHNKASHHNYLLYKLIKANDSLKISEIVWF